MSWLAAPALVIGIAGAQLGMSPDQQPTAMLPPVAIIAISGAQILVCSIALAVFCYRYGSLEDVLGMSRGDWVAGFPIGIKWFAMVVPALLGLQALLAQLVPYEHATMEHLQNHFEPLTILALWFSATVAAPLCEEFLFRGVFQGWLQRLGRGTTQHQDSIKEMLGGWPQEPTDDSLLVHTQSDSSTAMQFWWPILISSAIFAAVHIGQGAAPVVLFFFGLILGYLYRKTGSLVPAIVLHFLLNTFSMFWATIELVSKTAA